MQQDFDVVVCGSCVADITCRPVNLDLPIGPDATLRCDPITFTPGGFTCNAAFALAALGIGVEVLTRVGEDAWADLITQRFDAQSIGRSRVSRRPGEPTSTTVALVDAKGRRSFLHSPGAHRQLDAGDLLADAKLWTRRRALLLGYYAMLPALEPDLPEVFARVREAGCMTVLDTSSGGGSMHPLDRILPETDVYWPSRVEAVQQTGEDDPRRMIERYREAGAVHTVGIKLGEQGSLLSPAAGRWIDVPCFTPPGPMVDTTGAGDILLASYVAGVLGGYAPESAARLAAAAAAISVTTPGGTRHNITREQCHHLAGLA